MRIAPANGLGSSHGHGAHEQVEFRNRRVLLLHRTTASSPGVPDDYLLDRRDHSSTCFGLPHRSARAAGVTVLVPLAPNRCSPRAETSRAALIR